MAKVKGMKEKLHLPIYDAFFVPDNVKFETKMTDPRTIRFFVDIQDKTRLETNLQASGVLPSENAFEARAMRVVVSPPTGELDSPPSRVDHADFLAQLIYSSVTALIVGDKTMIEMPTFYFPAGAGVSPGNGAATNHGAPDPMATFRFAEPVVIVPKQNFRVEMSFPRNVPNDVRPMEGPLHIWVVLDGYLTRDVQ